MAKYLSQAWLDLLKVAWQEFPERPGATARIQYVVTGAPDGDVKYCTIVENGKVLDASLGEDSQAEFTLTSGYDDSVKMLTAELDTNAAFMQGKVKVAGDTGKLLSLMPLTQSADYKAIQARVAEQTEY